MIHTVHDLNPAFAVIEKLGGKTALAGELGLHKSTLTRWCQPRPEGTGGQIPQKYWPSLMGVARSHGVRLGLKDLAVLE
jgi:hypothetical protein